MSIEARLSKLLLRDDIKSIDQAVALVEQTIIEKFEDILGVPPTGIREALVVLGRSDLVNDYKEMLEAYDRGDKVRVMVKAYKIITEMRKE